MAMVLARNSNTSSLLWHDFAQRQQPHTVAAARQLIIAPSRSYFYRFMVGGW